MIRVAVCDAEPSFTGKIEKTLLESEYENGLEVEYYKREDSYDIEELCNRYGHMDLIFMALHPKRGPDGYYMARKLKEADPNLKIVFVAADKMVNPEIMNLQPLGFLPLPADERRIRSFIRECISLRQDSFIFKKDQTITAVPAGHICYIKKEDPNYRKIYIYCADGMVYDPYMSVAEVEKELKRSNIQMIRITNSCFVNPFFIMEMNKSEVLLRAGLKVAENRLIPSRGYRIKAYIDYELYCSRHMERFGIEIYT